MAHDNEKIKALADLSALEIATLPLSNLARWIAILIQNDITDKSEIARQLNKSVRTIERAYAELRKHTQICVTNDTQSHVSDTQDRVNDDTQNCVPEYANTRICVSDTQNCGGGTIGGGITNSELEKDKKGSKISFSDSYSESRCGVDDSGQPQIFNGLRQTWLDKFDGDEERLDLALVQAAPYVQTNSNRPLEAQISAQLARQLAMKRDGDRRYQAARNERKSENQSEFDRLMDIAGKVGMN